jgi:putative membrane protein insertion efficiency factor
MTKELPMLNAECRVEFQRSIGHLSFVVRVLTMAIRAYQLIFSPLQTFLFGATGACRYTPSCSAYAVEALKEHGAIKGTALAAKRICRCHPWGGCGHDPVPPKNQKSKIRI